MKAPGKLMRVAIVLVAGVIALLLQVGDDSDKAPGAVDDAAAIAAAFEAERSDLWVESGGTVERKLKDDREGSMHQRFIVRLSNGHSVLIAHNIDLAPRVPVEVGDTVSFKGEFEWNPRGGVVHWTHHDPRGRKPGGWIRHGSSTYR